MSKDEFTSDEAQSLACILAVHSLTQVSSNTSCLYIFQRVEELVINRGITHILYIYTHTHN